MILDPGQLGLNVPQSIEDLGLVELMQASSFLIHNIPFSFLYHNYQHHPDMLVFHEQQ
jgi:hypothetical protein